MPNLFESKEGDGVRNKMYLTAADAQKIVSACELEANKNKLSVSIAVVADGGFLLHLERLDGAMGQSAEIATLSVRASPTLPGRAATRAHDLRAKSNAAG